MIFKKVEPSQIFNCKQDDLKFNPEPVNCFIDVSQPEPVVNAGDRYIVQNLNSVDPSWILPDTVEENDIIERDFQNSSWLLSTDVSELGPGVLVYIECRGYYYWFNGSDWCELYPHKRFEKIVESQTQEILDGVDVTNFTAVQWNVTVSYLDGTRRRFQTVLATHEAGINPEHNVSSIVGSKKNFFDYDIEVSITSSILNLIIINNSLTDDYKIQAKRIPIENLS